MKYVDEYRNAEAAQTFARGIRRAVTRPWTLMEVCGGQTHSIVKYGIDSLLPPEVTLVHGPGCPVCVTPLERVDLAIELAWQPDVILATFADMMRVPGSRSSLQREKARGADVRMVYSSLDALALARAHPQRQVVFFAIGFETTTPPTGVVLRQAAAAGLPNFSVVSNHVLTPAAITHILESPEVRELGTLPLDGFLGPSHVSTVIGSRPYEFFAEEYEKPVVIAGFEPLDVMQAILMLIRQVNQVRAEVENQLTRLVTPEGNPKAKGLVADVFELRKTFRWRGLGEVPYSGLAIKAAYADFDAERRFGLASPPKRENQACICPSVLRGVAKPTACPLFGTTCTPDNPIGSCMVSSEGACAAYYAYCGAGSTHLRVPRAESVEG